MVKKIKENKENEKTVETDFILAHNLYARAEIPPTDKVIYSRMINLSNNSYIFNSKKSQKFLKMNLCYELTNLAKDVYIAIKYNKDF